MLAAISLTIAAIVVAGATASLAVYATKFVPLNYNEGWAAYHVESFANGQGLYHPMTSVTLNNYPPLFFVVSRLILPLVPDAIFAGRLISGLSLAVMCGLVAFIVYYQTKNGLATVLSTTLFLGGLTINFAPLVFANEPQIMAESVMLGGLSILIAGKRNERLYVWVRPIVAAALMVLGVFTKHNPIAMILASASWLLLTDRRRFAVYAVSGVAFGSIMALLCVWWFGPDFIVSISAPRIYSLKKIWTDTLIVPAPLIATYLLSTLIAFQTRIDEWGLFLILYLFCSLGLGVLVISGEGVGVNAWLEMVTAVALSAGGLIACGSVESNGGLRHIESWIVIAYCGTMLWNTETSVAKDIFLYPSWRTELMRREAETRLVVELVAKQAGPGFCEKPIFCYWARKPVEFDGYWFQEGLHAHQFTDLDLANRFDSRQFSVAVVDSPESNLHLTPGVLDAIHREYRLAHKGLHEQVYVRR